MNDIQRFSEILKEKLDQVSTVAIMSHTSPDGDNLGSLDALWGYLTGLNKKVAYLSNDDVPKDFAFLPSTKARIDVDTVDESFPILIALDSSDADRFGPKGKALFEKAAFTVNIDHHMSNESYADLNCVLPEATSTGEVLYRALKAMNARITTAMATGFYTAISTDTGSFQYDSVNADTHRIIAELYDAGCNHNVVVQSVYQSMSKEKLALSSRVLSSLRFLAGGKVSVAICRSDDFEATGASKDDTEGIVESARNIDGVEMAIFLKEKPDEVKLSFRSKSYLDCTEFASAFGGGGHIRAAGASAKDSIENILAKVEALIREKCEA
ncbi:MAG: bifunctional oligoribonuclease/PAP phosphatase NrnA [Peptoniphilus sp.]|nr:bifunctional oligoribonuclease/PAP phosphatase NrnA [Peptoniphilus sp.]MDY3119314.1 bifunctional oligoribonuclease/PAP phosphatase NrnA [Peptoniphilus sp.]